MIERQTVVDKIEVLRSGIVQIRLGLLLVEDGVELDCKWHRMTLEPGKDWEESIAIVNAHLFSMKLAPLPDLEIERVKALIPAIHSEEVVRKFKEGK